MNAVETLKSLIQPDDYGLRAESHAWNGYSSVILFSNPDRKAVQDAALAKFEEFRAVRPEDARFSELQPGTWLVSDLQDYHGPRHQYWIFTDLPVCEGPLDEDLYAEWVGGYTPERYW